MADLISTSPVLSLRSGTKKAPQLGLKCLILSVKFDVTCQHKGTNFSLNLKYFFKKHSVHKDNIITGMDETSCIHLFSVRLTSKVFGIQTNVVSSPFFAVNQSGYGVNGPRLRKRECKLNFSDLRAYPLIILANVFN